MLQILTPTLPALGIGQPIGDQSDAVRTLITPAGWAFSIWGALYTGSLVFAVHQALPSQRDSMLARELRWLAALAFLGNALWALYTQSAGLTALSVVIIFFTLACLLRIFRTFALWRSPFTAGERWCAVLPLSALASWLSVASIVNVAAALRFHGVEGGSATPMIAAALLVIGGLIAAGALISSFGNPPFALVFLWALAAIYAAGGQQATPVALGAGLAALLVIGATAIGLRGGRTSHWFAAPGRR
ncbi:hypothetical protein LWE61_16755 [Sphingobium sufflavum]|uniref:hypothetical protein n=1 Tax=Sphingobium sufflavum TaxID=1129547 RepID=UPI001F163FF8|nr:hypothetical protein [Sphingobium sufflavum]MCE7798191.1 hypothetical protein [Sphingobium sufflavum]